MFALAMAAAVYSAWPTFREAFTAPDFSRNWRQDCDLVLIHKGLVTHPRFRDTLDWWTGTWVGQVPFWRPLTSLLFWLEWKAFGWENQDAWMLVHLLAFIGSITAFFCFVELLSRSSITAWVAVLLLLFAPPSFLRWLWSPDRSLMVWDAIQSWKNTPDLVLAVLTFTALLLCLRRHYRAAAFLAIIAPAVKETGFALCAIVAVWCFVRRRLFIGAVLGVVIFVMVAIKLLGPGVGYRVPTVSPWHLRMFRYVIPAQVALQRDAVAPVGILLIALSLCACWPRRWRYLLAALGMGLLVYGFAIGLTPLLIAGALADPYVWFRVLATALWSAGALWGMSRATLLAAAGAVAFAVPCTIAVQVWPHAYYVSAALQAAAVAIAWWCTWRKLVHKFNSQVALGRSPSLCPIRT